MRHHSSAALSRRSESGIFVPTNPAHCSHLYLSPLGRCLFTLVVTRVSVLTWVLVRSHDCLRQRDSLHEHRGPSPSLSLGRKKRLSQESAVGVRWLLVLSVCLLALDHCESTTFAIFQRLQPRNQPKTLDSAQDLPSNQKMSRKDLSAGNCRALKNSCSVQSITRVDWDTTCLPRHAVGQNNCLHN